MFKKFLQIFNSTNHLICPALFSFFFFMMLFDQITPFTLIQENSLILLIIFFALLSILQLINSKLIYDSFDGLILGFLFSSLLRTLTSPLDLMRSVDFLLLVFSVSFFSIIFYKKRKYTQKIAIYSVIFPFSLFIFNLIGFLMDFNEGWFQTTGFIGLFLTILFYLYHSWNANIVLSDFLPKEKIRYVLISFFLGLWSLLIFTEQSDFEGTMSSLGWRNSSHWSFIVFITCIFSYLIIITNEGEDNSIRSDYYSEKISNLKLNIIVPLIISSLLFYQTIFNQNETEQYASYHLGLMNILASHAVEFGVFSQCSSDHLVPNNVADLYPSCWVYPTGWWNVGLWPLIMLHKLGFDTIFYSKLITLLFQFCILLQLYSLAAKFGNEISAIVVCIVYSTSSQVIFSSQVYAFQWPMIIWMLLFLNSWIHTLESRVKISRINWAILVPGPFLFGHMATVFLIGVFVFSLYNRKRPIIDLLYPFLISILSSIIGLFVWIKVIDYYWQKGGGSSSQLWEKAEKRSNQENFLLDFDYYLVIFERITILLEGLIILSVLFLIHTFVKKYFSIKDDDHDIINDNLFTLCSGFLMLFFYVVFFWPEAYFHHSYLTVIWLIIPGSLASIFILNRNFDVTNIVVIFLLFFSVLFHSPNYEYREADNDSLLELQEWMASEISHNDDVLLSQDIYMNHLLAYYSGSSVLVRPVNSSGDYVKNWISSDKIDILIVSNTSWDNWGLENYQFEKSWCPQYGDKTFKIPDLTYQEWEFVKILKIC